MPDTKGRYSVDEIRNGFQRYQREYGHYPSAREIDSCSYLPTARQLQRRFGGVIETRKSLGLLTVDLSSGESRSRMASQLHLRSQIAERETRKILEEYFGRQFVHVERPVGGDTKLRYDFYIFSSNGEFAIDVFCSTNNRAGLTNEIRMKIESYRRSKTQDKLYLVLWNTDVSQEMLDEITMSNKRKLLSTPENISVMNQSTFLNEIQRYKPIIQTRT